MQAVARSAYPVIIVLALIVLAPMAALLTLGVDVETNSAFWRSLYLRQVVLFSLWQAFLSTLISLGLAVLVARSFAVLGKFPCRDLLLRLFGIPLVVPAVVAILGVVSVYGSQGWLAIGPELYGLPGILLAHVFFNLPLAVRLLLPAWVGIPEQHWRLADQLNFNQWQQWRHLEWPALRESLPGVALLVFMLCLTSFAVVLTLGGGPKSTTIEVAIYQSLRFEFEPAQAVVLALLQFSLCAVLGLLSLRMQKLPEVEITLVGPIHHRASRLRLIHVSILTSAAAFVLLPMLSMLIDAFNGPVVSVLTGTKLWRSAALSLGIGLSAALLCISAAWLLLRSSSDLAYLGRKQQAAFLELGAQVVYVVPPLVIGTGLFVLIAPHFDVFDWAIPIVILINAMMGLPFAIRSLGPAMRQSKMRYQRLCQSLRLDGWNRFKLIDWPILRKPVGLATALVTALAMGDLGVIALFGTPQTTTLPLLIYQQLGAYLMPEAAVSAAFLLSFCLFTFWLLERLIGGHQHA